jgi:hypothetical protein
MFRIWQDECPGENLRVLAQRALDACYGVDLNPFAVAIARFRLLLAALQVSGVRQLRDAPDFQIHVAAGDSLLHGRRFRESESFTAGAQRTFDTGEEIFRDELKHHYEVEDGEALHRILGQQYHAVVGNPPYITVKDAAVSELYRARYPSCHRQYSLSVPFMERFFDLAVKGDGTPQQPAGFVGQITANSFMKREFGKKLIEQYVPRWDLTHILDTSGAYIPGHGTPTVILFGKNQPPVSDTIRTVLGIRAEPAKPADPALGLVWQAIVKQIDQPGSESEWVSASDSPRAKFYQHPWSIGGGGAAELKESVEDSADSTLGEHVSEMGFLGMTHADEAMVADVTHFIRHRVEPAIFRPLVSGEKVRDWGVMDTDAVFFPYGLHGLVSIDQLPEINRVLWPCRTELGNRATFSKRTYFDEGRAWWEWHQIALERLLSPLTITWSEIATNNNFFLDRGGSVFSQTAPVMKLRADMSLCEHIQLLGVLNSSVGCFWMKQCCFPKGGSGIGRGIQNEAWESRYAFNATAIASLPIPERQPTQLPTVLVQTSTALQAQSPAATLASWGGSASGGLRPWLASARLGWSAQRQFNIAWQEELDWQIYEAFGLIEPTDQVSQPEGVAMDAIPPDGIRLGQRAFEIVLARRMAAGEVQTTWFGRHGSTPITQVPSHWPAAYRELVERRIARIESDSSLRLIEQPEYKRRWNTESWEKSQQEALRQWLLARLEGYFHEGSRVCDLAGSFDPAAHGFTAAARPHLVSANQLADAVQSDARFLEAAEVYEGAAGFSVSKLIRSLVESESVPVLPRDRYKDSGLRKRVDWEETWKLQRVEDEIDAEAARLDAGIESRIMELVNRTQPDLTGKLETARKELELADEKFHQQFFSKDPYDADKPYYKRSINSIKSGQESEWFKLDTLANALGATEHQMALARIEVSSDDEVLRLKELKDQLPPKPDIAVPPKYAGTDFKKTSYWKLRGKLDVPKERWISYPGAERAGDDSLLIAWAGWDHLQQAQALAGYFIDARDNQAFAPERLKSLLAGLADLIPWLKQWHNTLDPDLGMGLGDYFAGFLEEQCRALGMTVEEVDGLRFGK